MNNKLLIIILILTILAIVVLLVLPKRDNTQEIIEEGNTMLVPVTLYPDGLYGDQQ